MPKIALSMLCNVSQSSAYERSISFCGALVSLAEIFMHCSIKFPPLKSTIVEETFLNN